MIKLGVIFGGTSVEHEISILSAIRTMDALNKEKYEIVPILIDKDGTFYTGNALRDIENYKDMNALKRYLKKVILTKNKNYHCLKSIGVFSRVVTDIDFVLPVVHGAGIEDGSLCGYLNILGIPYAMSDLLSSSIGQDKVIMKQLLKFNGINVVNYCFTYDNLYKSNPYDFIKEVEKLGFPVIVKPANLGSSIGIKVVNNESSLKEALNDVFVYDRKVIVEKLVENLVELNCSVLGNYEYVKTSAIDKTISSSSFLTFEEKYLGNGKKKGMPNKGKGMASSKRELPAIISDELKLKIETMAKDTFNVIGNLGLVRIDFMLDKKTNEVFVNEINTIPGDLSFYLWEETGLRFSDLLDEIITIGIKEQKKKHNKITTFDNNIFATYGMTGLKGVKANKGK